MNDQPCIDHVLAGRLSVGDLIFEELILQEWSQTMLARKCNVSPSIINKAVNDRIHISKWLAAAICAAFGWRAWWNLSNYSARTKR